MSENRDDGPLKVDGFNDCIIGLASRCGKQDLVAYDVQKMIDQMQKQDGMTEEEAWDFYSFNIAGAWMGEGTPIFVDPGVDLETIKEMAKNPTVIMVPRDRPVE